jgi:hypothetical protein
MSPRTTHAVLAALEAHGLIAEQQPPRQHRPRTWKLNLSKIAELSGPQDPAALKRSPDLQDPAVLQAAAVPPPPHDSRPAPQESSPAPQNSSSGPQPGAEDPVLLNCSNSPLNLAFSRSQKEDDEERRHQALLKTRAVAIEVLDACATKGEVEAAVREQLADVAPDVLEAAVSLVWAGRQVGAIQRKR